MRGERGRQDRGDTGQRKVNAITYLHMIARFFLVALLLGIAVMYDGSSKDGFALTTQGISWKNAKTVDGISFVSWQVLKVR